MNYKYEVTLSFAGEDRKYVEEVATCLKSNGVEVFYDKFNEDVLWGKDLYIYLDEVYRQESMFCIMFLSRHYANKAWTNHERESAQARAFQQHEEYILPVKLDDTEIPGIRPTTGYLDGTKKTPNEICSAILKKLSKPAVIKQKKEEDDDEIYIPKIRREITDLEKRKFLKSSFAEVKAFFEKALTKLEASHSNVEVELDSLNSSKFTSAIYVEGQLKIQCKIWIGGSFGANNSISYLEGNRNLDIANDNSLNDSATVNDNGHEMYFEILGMMFGHLEGTENLNLKHASSKEVAKYYWARFTNHLEY